MRTSSSTPIRRHRWTLLLQLLLLGMLTAACGADDVIAAPTDAGEGPVPRPGVVAVRLEPVEGIFVKGFEAGIRFETGDGEMIAATLWGDAVRSSVVEPAPEDFYRHVVEQEVPSGEVIVLAQANVGIGPPPEVPNLDDLGCRLAVQVPPGGRVEVELTFAGPPDCLRLS